MRNILYLLLCCASLVHAQPNFNITPVGTLQYNVELSAIWGYTAPDSTEYALVGTYDGTSIVSLANPAAPREVAFIDGTNSIWRELKTWGHYIYVVADGTSDGILIIDANNLPNSTTHHFYKPTITIGNATDSITKAHTLYIEGDYLYLSGTNMNGGGVLIFDIASNPLAPVYVGCIPSPIYAHDCFVRNDTLWTADIMDGFFSVYDISNKSTPVHLANQNTPNHFTHNVWISGDGRTLFTTDERADAFVTAYDVSDLSNITELDRYRSRGAATSGVIPHNAHVLNDYVWTSYYTDGVILIDGSRPQNLVEVGRYDSYLGTQQGFYGDWGVYPYFRSGLVILSDINTGLHVLNPTYQRACWLEGTITDKHTNATIVNAHIELVSTTITDSTNATGIYRTGTTQAGTYTVRISKTGYYTHTDTATLTNGQLTILDAQLTPVTSGISTASMSYFQAYPNPSQRDFSIESAPQITEQTLQIYNAIGQLIETHTIAPNTHLLTIGQHWNAGAYLLRINKNTTTLIKH